MLYLWIFSYIEQKYDRFRKTGFCLNFSFEQSCQKGSRFEYYLKSIYLNIFWKNSVEIAAYYRMLQCIKFDAWDKKIDFDFDFSEASFLLLNRTLWLFLKYLCLVASTFHFEAILPNRNRGQNFFDFSTLRVLVQISKN